MKYKVGDIAEGKVTGIQPYGAFVSLDDGINGLIHISEISEGYVKDITRFVHVGDDVKVKIIDCDENNNQVRLSLKALRKKRAQSRNRSIRQKASLPSDDIGFRSIAEKLDEWVSIAKEQMNKEGSQE